MNFYFNFCIQKPERYLDLEYDCKTTKRSALGPGV